MADNAHQPNLNLTPEEKRVFYQLFQVADTTNLGVITGEIAVPFFEKTKLAPETLGLIWQIADRENRGLLTPSGFGVVMRLIGHAQAGRAPTDELALQPGPLPKFDGITVDTAAPSPRRDTGAGSPQPTPGGAPIRVPPLNPEDANKFVSLFEKSDVTRSGTISGETAKQIFERARLPNEILGRIWNLADTNQRGVLDTTEFIIAMHLLTSFKSGVLRGIPQVLPPGLYEAAARRGGRISMSGSRGGLDVPPVPAIPKQFTGPQRTQSPITRQQFGSPLSAQSTGGEWLVSPAEKLQFDNYFNTVDTTKSGVISGDQAVSFFTKAQLPEETLAQIWDLADIDADGQLTKDEFAVAMYLIRQQYTGKGPMPQTLPPALIPPSMRRPGSAQAVRIPAPVPGPVAAPIQPLAPVHTAADDLFGLDPFATAPAVPSPLPAQVPQSTGNSNSPFPMPSSPGRPTSPPGSATTFKPFIPSSSFGQSLHPQVTGASSAPSTARSPPQPSDDLLGDNDPEESNKLTQETTELANLSNQIGTLANEMQNVQTKRSGTEQELSQTSQQKRDFESRLAQARAMYEQEVANFKALEERLKTSKAETSKLQQEYALIDGGRQDLQNQYNQVSAALAADQQENASLKEKIREANAAVAQLKPTLEKIRSDARQQKGLAAINKKQLATVEGERDKIQEEIDGLPKEIPLGSEEVASPISSPLAVTSPAASTTSQHTNPFFKRTMTGSSENNNVASPQISNDQQRAFDSLFGPSFGAAPATTVAAPPPTSFRADSQTDSAMSPVGSGIPTPSVSPPPSSIGAFGSEPPPPSVSRQMTPNALPLTGTLSETTSTKVSPPGSRFGTQDTFSVGTPSRAGGSEARAASTSPFDETEDSKDRFPPIPGAFDSPSRASTSLSNEDKSAEVNDPSFDELFGGPAHQRSKSQKNNDFEEAFAALKGPNAAKSDAAPESEFPPIHEIDDDDDDDDDSTDSETQLGFDDNFTPVLPQSHAVSKSDQIEPAQLAAFPIPGAASSPTLPPPAAESQASPPKYDEGAEKQTPGNIPPEFSGLLPNRADPTAAPDAPHSVETSTGAPIVGGEAQPGPKTSPPAQAPSGTKAPDFEAAFSGLNLAPAKEADDDEDDDDDFGRSEGRQNADFDFSFDSAASQQQSAAAPTSTSGNTSSDFFSFDQKANAPSSSGPVNPTTKPDDHDWEALFAPLDNAKSPGAEATNGAPLVSSPESKPPGWALQNDTQDDPNLQRLTGMGFPREASLGALEKFDYNIDMAIDYLTSKV